MNSVPHPTEKLSVRQRAELQAEADVVDTPNLSPEAARQVQHELRVHQLELEMQNEELRRTQQELEASCLRFFDLYELAPVGYVTVSDQGLILMANLTAATLLGVDRVALIKQPISHLILPEDQDCYYQHRQALGATGAPQVCELRLLRANAAPIWARLETTCTQNAESAMTIRHVMIDITRSKQAEADLRASEAKHRRLVEDSHDIIYTLTAEGIFLFVSPAWRTLLGHPTSQVVGQSFQPFVHPDDLAECLVWLRKVIATGQRQEGFEYRVQHLDGSWRWHSSSAVPLRDETNAIIGFEGIARDITRIKQAELEQKKLEAQNRQLQKTESLNRMAEAIAHHFNNQLAAVMMCLELARNDLPLNAGLIIEHLALAMKAARDAAKVSSLLLTYLGQTPGKREPLALSEVCRSHLIIVRIALARNVTLETDFPSPGPVISADVNQIQHVVTNLVLNAGEAMAAAGGSIRVTLRTVAPADIPAAHRLPVNWQAQAPAYACLEVADAGCGIAPHDIEKLGEPFFTNKFTGRGLGLSAVLGIVRAHQGVLTVESRLDQGSTFRVFLPVTAEAVPQRPEPVVQAPFIREGIHVLLVDDELAVRRSVMQALGRFGFAVLTAADGHEAVDLFRQHADKISLVLCDLTMPRMNGWETLAALRLLAPDIPVILASGYHEAYAMAGYHPEQPQAFLNKPYALSELRHTLSEVLQHAEKKRLKTGGGKTNPQGRL